jgi:tetratricopeptide (TPR) repeat protein
MQANDLATELLGLWNFGDPADSERRFRTLLERVSGDPEAEAVVRTQIARAQGLQRRFDEGHATLDEVEAAPAARGARTAVRLALERGRLVNSAQDPARARPFFAAAWERASEAGEDALAVDAAHMLAIVETDPALQATWNERALALAESSRDPLARRWRASLLNNHGWTRHGEGRFVEALDLFERALAARRELGEAGSIRVARWCVARALRSLGRLDEALAEQRELADECAATGSPDGFVFEELGECLLALGRSEEAGPWFARAHSELAKDPWFVEAELERLERLRIAGQGQVDASGRGQGMAT